MHLIPVVRVVGAVMSALVTAGALFADLQGFNFNEDWQVAALISFFVFVAFVVWGWGLSEYRLWRHHRTENLLMKLSDLKRQGTDLQDEGWTKIRHEKDALDTWWHRVKIWQARVGYNMDKIHKADFVLWGDIGHYRVRSFRNVQDDSQAAHYLTKLSILLDKLESYISDRTKK